MDLPVLRDLPINPIRSVYEVTTTTPLCHQLRKTDNHGMLMPSKESISMAFPGGSSDMYIPASVSMSDLEKLNSRIDRRRGTVLGLRAHRDELVKKEGCMGGGGRVACG